MESLLIKNYLYHCLLLQLLSPDKGLILKGPTKGRNKEQIRGYIEGNQEGAQKGKPQDKRKKYHNICLHRLTSVRTLEAFPHPPLTLPGVVLLCFEISPEFWGTLNYFC